MKILIASAALLITGFVAASTQEANAAVYCTYVGYPGGCIVRPGVVLRPGRLREPRPSVLVLRVLAYGVGQR